LKKLLPLIAIASALLLFLGACDNVSDVVDRAREEAPREEAAQPTPTVAVTVTVNADSVSADSVSAEEAPTFTEQQIAEFADFVEQARREHQIPGVAAALVDQNGILFAEGFGVRAIDSNDAVTAETLFHIGSTHKSITAMLIATLVDDGLLTWDTPVVDLYSDFALSDPQATQTVTLRHLLSMSSGIPAEAEDDFDTESESAEDLFPFLAETDLAGQPGEAFSYSNLSAAIAGYIGVLATESEAVDLYNGYAQLLQERIFDPIGMPTATLSVEEAEASPNHAASHIVDEDGEVSRAESYDFTGDPLAPAGSIKANVVEMARYMSTQVNRGIAPDGTLVVREESLTETWQPQIADEEAGGWYGLGWGIQTDEGVTVIYHEGSYDNFTSLLLFIPTAKSGMVLLTNVDDPGDFLEVVSERFIELSSAR